MSWNSSLYCYSLIRGGTYFGCSRESAWFGEEGWDASLVLEYRGEPVLVNCAVLSSGRYGCSYAARALLRCTLQRDYSLAVKSRSVVRQGMKAAMDRLDKGAEKFGLEIPSAESCGELKGRGIKSSDPPFTRLVLGNLELRNALLAAPKSEVFVNRCRPSFAPDSDRAHLITAQSPLADWSLGEPDVFLNSEQQRAQAESGDQDFFRRLDGLLELARTARAAVTAWPMPDMPQGKV